MMTLHEQAVEVMAETTLTALGSYKRTKGDVARANLQALLSLIKDNEELIYDIAAELAKEDVKSTNDAVRFTLAALTKALGDD